MRFNITESERHWLSAAMRLKLIDQRNVIERGRAHLERMRNTLRPDTVRMRMERLAAEERRMEGMRRLHARLLNWDAPEKT